MRVALVLTLVAIAAIPGHGQFLRPRAGLFFASSSYSSSWLADKDGKIHEQVHQEHIEAVHHGASVDQAHSQVDCVDGLCERTFTLNQQRQHQDRPDMIMLMGADHPTRSARIEEYFRGLNGKTPTKNAGQGPAVLAGTVKPAAWTRIELVLMLAIVPSTFGAFALLVLWTLTSVFKCCSSVRPEPEHPLQALEEALLPTENAVTGLELARASTMATAAQAEPPLEENAVAMRAVRTYLLCVFASAESKVIARATRAYVKTLYTRA